MKYNGGVAANYTQQSRAAAGPDTLHNETITSHLHNIRQDLLTTINILSRGQYADLRVIRHVNEFWKKKHTIIFRH